MSPDSDGKEKPEPGPLRLESGGGPRAGDIPLDPRPEDQERRGRGCQGGPPGLRVDARAGVSEPRGPAGSTIVREGELERTVRELGRSSSELERERDEARDAAAVSRDTYEELDEAYRKERAAHGQTKQLTIRLGVTAAGLFVLLVISVLVMWLLLT